MQLLDPDPDRDSDFDITEFWLLLLLFKDRKETLFYAEKIS